MDTIYAILEWIRFGYPKMDTINNAILERILDYITNLCYMKAGNMQLVEFCWANSVAIHIMQLMDFGYPMIGIHVSYGGSTEVRPAILLYWHTYYFYMFIRTVEVQEYGLRYWKYLAM